MNNFKILLDAAAFAAKKHTGQTRKGEAGEPYINHPLEVAHLLSSIGNIDDHLILTAALLHDTVEDTATTADEIALRFGRSVADIVLEVTDDKNLPKQERKRLQIEHAPHLSTAAKLVKLADKISNIIDVTNHPPADWNAQRRLEYVEWGRAVVAGLRGVNAELDRRFDEVAETAERSIA